MSMSMIIIYCSEMAELDRIVFGFWGLPWQKHGMAGTLHTL